jgi:hypothetical protein
MLSSFMNMHMPNEQRTRIHAARSLRSRRIILVRCLQFAAMVNFPDYLNPYSGYWLFGIVQQKTILLHKFKAHCHFDRREKSFYLRY